MVKYKTLELNAAAPIHIDYTNGVLRVQPAQIRGTGTDLHLQGTLPLSGNVPSSLAMAGTADLRLLMIVAPDIRSGGQLEFKIDSSGTLTHPGIQGQIRIVNASLQSPSLPIGLQNANGLLTLRPNRIDVTQFQADLGSGKVTASGGVVYRPAIQFDIGIKAQGVRLLYPEGVRTQSDSDLGLTGNLQAALLRGTVRL